SIVQPAQLTHTYSVSSPILLPPSSPLSPYTTLFRSGATHRPGRAGAARTAEPDPFAEAPRECAELASLPRPAKLASTPGAGAARSEEHTSELQSLRHLVCRLLLEKKK